MSATLPPPDRRYVSGFTLLELVVVLALLGLATALVAPQGFRMIDSWQRATEVDAVLGALAALGARASNDGRAIGFEEGPIDAARLDGMPEGWTVVLEEPLRVRANGACSGTTGLLRAGNYERRFALTAPYCRVVLDPIATP